MAEAGWQFLRPLWLWGFVPLAAALWWWWRRPSAPSDWEPVVDPALRPYVIERGEPMRRARDAWPLFAAWALALVALAGPVWERAPAPPVEARRAEVVLFDLSRSMLANDLTPDRLTRARYKLADLIARAGGDRLGLAVFSERPYVVSPLTDDARTLEAFLPSLSPEIMPVQGSRPDLAIEQGVTLLERAGAVAGSLLLITDASFDERDVAAARAARERGHRVSVLGVGTAGGAPLGDADGRFLRRDDGSVVVARLDTASQASLAAAGGGVAVTLGGTEADLDALASARERAPLAVAGTEPGASVGAARWVERAPWLLPPIALLALGLFRRGVLR